jgi:hypothetical protein
VSSWFKVVTLVLSEAPCFPPYNGFEVVLGKVADIGSISQREVAAILGVSTGAAISLQLRRFEALVADNRKLRSLAKKCDKAPSALMSTARKAQN